MNRTHVSRTDQPIVLRDVKAADATKTALYKPQGFWYEVDGDWRRWCEAEDFRRGGFLHSVDLRNCNVLFLDCLPKLDRFNSEFGVRDNRFGSYVHVEIDWQRVSELYDGVEIAPYQWKRRLADEFSWYYGWDCASGVIWRPRNAAVTYLGPVPEPTPEAAERA